MGTQGNPAGNISTGRPAGRSFKTILKIEKAVRLEARGLTDDQIAAHLGYSSAASFNSALKSLPEYQTTRVRLLTGIISELDDELADSTEYLRAKVADAIPQALQVLVQNLENSDQKIAISAAESLIDRHGKLAKVSRIGLPTDEQGGSGVKSFKASLADELVAELKQQGASNGNTGQSNGNVGTTTTP